MRYKYRDREEDERKREEVRDFDFAPTSSKGGKNHGY